MAQRRRAVLVCASFFAFAGAAAAQAPITYAGRGESAPQEEQAPVQVASLAGGDDNSYGYGSERNRGGATIDIRRGATTAPRYQPPVRTEVEADEEDEAPAAPQAPAQTTQVAAEQGRSAPTWLERERVGPPYEANGQWYVPTPEPGYSETGVASWYGPTFHGQATASGETFDQEALTAAHPTLPIPSLVQVTNLENGREVIVRVNDRGPFVGQRLIDLSRRSAEVLGFEQAGQARVHVRYLGPAPRRVNADGSAAPATRNVPAVQAAAPGQGPTSLLPAPVQAAQDTLAGAPVNERPLRTVSYSPPAQTGSFFVQVGAYSDLANAHRVRDAVGAAGPVAVDVRQASSGAELFRVRVGPWNSREEAESARRDVASLGYGEAVIAR